MIHFIGNIFWYPPWHQDEIDLVENLKKQIEDKFPDETNLLLNLTWFGPQFKNNNEYKKFLKLIENTKIDNLFLQGSGDPVHLSKEETTKLFEVSKAKKLFLLGNFDSRHCYSFHSFVISKYFEKYSLQDLKMKKDKYIFLNYNRKPAEHRVNLVKLLDQQDLSKHGIITLANERFLEDDVNDEKGWSGGGYSTPHDIHSLGRLDIWQNHFLTIVSETDYQDFLWTFVSEKTFKPLLGLRPFVINGQTDTYKWLTKRGFKTFNKYWNHINVENCDIDDVHPNICKVVNFLKTQNLTELYTDMLDDLIYNRERFYEFAKEQKIKMDNVFC